MGRTRLEQLRKGGRILLRVGWVPLLILAILLLPRFVTLHPEEPAPAPEPGAQQAEIDQPELFTLQDTVRRGDTFSGLLVRNRVSMQDISQVLALNRRLQLFSPRALQPGQVLTLEHDDYGRLRRMTFEVSVEETYVFESKEDSLVAYLLPVERDVRLRKFEGQVETTFDDAVRAAGGDYRLTLKVADIFAYDVDFFTEVRKGDRFSLLVEEKFADGRYVGYGEVLYGRYDGAKAHSMAYYAPARGTRRGGYYDAKGHALRKAFLRSPLNFRRISSTFSNHRFHPILKRYRAHHGVDYAAATGTPVVAIADGVVRFAGWKGGYGRYIRVRHSGRTETGYGHLSRIAKGVRVGSRVRQGEVIGYVGSTGLATGPHLHYEVLQNGAAVNPLTLKNVPSDPLPADQLAWFEDYAGRLTELEETLLAGQVLESFDSDRLAATLAELQSAGPPPLR